MPEQFKVLLLSPLSIIFRGREKHLFQAWLDLELAAAFLSLSRHLCGTAAGLLAASAHE